MPRRLFQGAIGLLLLAAGITWFLKNYEQVDVEVEANIAEAVKTNPLIAAERFLLANGHPARSVSGRGLIEQLPPPSDTLIINNLFSSLSAEREQALLDWVEGGGHLFITPKKSWSKNENSGYGLLDRFGIHRHGSDFAFFGRSLDALADDESIRFRFPGMDAPLEAFFRDSTWLHSDNRPPDFSIPRGGLARQGDAPEAPAEYHLVQLEQGKGRVTVTSDNLFLTNDLIGKYDHAWLLYHLNTNPGEIWLLYDKAMPSLWKLLVEQASPLLAAAALLLSLLLWYAMRRSGPLLEPVDNRRRDLIEHLEATNRFYRRNGETPSIARSTQELVLGLWQSQHSCLDRMREQDQTDWISDHSGLARDEVKLALFTDATNREQLIRQGQLIQLLRLRIHRG